jgi:hypothetical protein
MEEAGPPRRLGDRLRSDNLILWLAPAFAAWACYLLCNALTSRPLAALAAEAIFRFPTHVGHHTPGR